MIPRRAEALPPGLTLKGYRIERVLRATALTLAYLAVDPGGRRLTLREYFPEAWARRTPGASALTVAAEHADAFALGLARFRAEGAALRGIHHAGLVQAVDEFADNGTEYLVTDYVEGETLASLLARAGTLPEDAIHAFLVPLLDEIEALHAAGIVHGDVEPDTIIIRDVDGWPLLLDLAAARTTGIAPSWGYAPLDEYPESGRAHGPWSDVYGVGATLYRCITGLRPLSALEREREIEAGTPDPLIPATRAGLGRYSPRLLAAVDAALGLGPANLPDSIGAFRALLDPAKIAGARRPRGMSLGLRSSVVSGSRPRLRRRAVVAFGALAALGIFVVYQVTAPSAPQSGEVVASRPPSDLARWPGTVFRDCATCPVMVVLPAGRFTMGAGADDADAADVERPQRTVTLARPFALGKYEVTVAEYAACAADGACPNRGENAPWGGGRMPVVKVSWSDAKAYAAWLARTTGKAYRLPSEAEWEFAARAGTTRRYGWGDRAGRNRANCEGCGSEWDGRQAAPVGRFRANAFGLHDMLGNVWEWTEDCWTPSLAGVAPDGRAHAPASCAGRVLRGGSWDLPAANMRVTSRTTSDPEVGEVFIGFRVLRVLDEARAAAAR